MTGGGATGGGVTGGGVTGGGVTGGGGRGEGTAGTDEAVQTPPMHATPSSVQTSSAQQRSPVVPHATQIEPEKQSPPGQASPVVQHDWNRPPHTTGGGGGDGAMAEVSGKLQGAPRSRLPLENVPHSGSPQKPEAGHGEPCMQR